MNPPIPQRDPSVWRRYEVCLVLCVLVATPFAVGCHRLRKAVDFRPAPPPALEVPVSNPAYIGEVDPDFLWRMVIDTLDDHFRIETEQPVRKNQETIMEGRVTTYPEVSGTTFEPWRRDTSRGFERLQSTFQTIRRTATVRVIPEATGYQINVEVIKEQEDVDQSQFATAGASAQRHDGSIVRNENLIRQLPLTLGWFEIGRDLDLERRIMEGILGRITNVEEPRRGLTRH